MIRFITISDAMSFVNRAGMDLIIRHNEIFDTDNNRIAYVDWGLKL